jgi:predicted RNase H-like HicB family nuclease
MSQRDFYVLIEKDEDEYFVGEVPQLRACYAQGRTLDELMANMRDVIVLSLEDESAACAPVEFVGVQKLTVSLKPI